MNIENDPTDLAPVDPNFDAIAAIVNRRYHQVVDCLGHMATYIRDFVEDLGIFEDGSYFEE